MQKICSESLAGPEHLQRVTRWSRTSAASHSLVQKISSELLAGLQLGKKSLNGDSLVPNWVKKKFQRGPTGGQREATVV